MYISDWVLEDVINFLDFGNTILNQAIWIRFESINVKHTDSLFSFFNLLSIKFYCTWIKKKAFDFFFFLGEHGLLDKKKKVVGNSEFRYELIRMTRKVKSLGIFKNIEKQEISYWHFYFYIMSFSFLYYSIFIQTGSLEHHDSYQCTSPPTSYQQRNFF